MRVLGKLRSARPRRVDEKNVETRPLSLQTRADAHGVPLHPPDVLDVPHPSRCRAQAQRQPRRLDRHHRGHLGCKPEGEGAIPCVELQGTVSLGWTEELQRPFHQHLDA